MTWKWIINLGDSLRALSRIPTVIIDGGLYVGMGITSVALACLSTDEAAKFVSPAPLFWIKMFLAVMDAVFLNLKMFRSNSFATHQQEKKQKEDQTQFFAKQKENG